jgi:hypothetical protein
LPEKEGKFSVLKPLKSALHLWSLWTIMTKFNAANCCGLFAVIGQRSQIASTSDPNSEIPPAWINNTQVTVLMPASFLAAELELRESLELIKRLFEAWKTKVLAKEYQYGLHHLAELLESEMRKRLCFSIPEHLARYVDQKEPCGPVVFKAFPSARQDLTSAGNSLGCGLNTAAAFHLMRAAEVGLWELGRDRQITSAVSGQIQFKEWGFIIRELETAVVAIQQWPNNSSKEDAHRFYNYALTDIRAFNDGWRRHTAHARPNMPPMQDSEALALWGHVSRFLETLATKIEEGSYTQPIW